MKTQIRCLCSSFAACGLIGTLALLLALESYSATVDWSGGGTDNNWTTPANWTGGTAPVMGDSLQFFWQQTSQSNYNDYADLTLFNHIGVGGGSPSLFSGYSIGGDRIYLLGGISVSGPAFNLDPNISLRMYCDVTLGADQTFTAERPLSLNGFLNVASYRLDISNSASISISSLAAVTSNALANTVYKRGAGTLSFPAGSQIVSSLPAQFNLEVDEGNVVLAGTANGCVFYLTNHGSMVLNGSAHEVRFTSGVTNTLTGTGYADNLFSDAGGIFIPGTSTAPGILQCGSFIPGGNPAATFRVRLNGTNAGTGYSQMVVTNIYYLTYKNVVYVWNESCVLDAKMGFASLIGDSFLIINSSSPYPYSLTTQGIFFDLPSGSVCDTTNGYSLAVLYDNTGVTLKTVRTPTSPFALWRGAGDPATLVLGDRNWTASNNWAQGVVPTTGSQVLFSPYQFPYFGTNAAPSITNNLAPGTSLASITFSGTNYALYGNSVAITGGISNNVSSGTNACHLDLAAPGTLILEADAGGTLLLDGAFSGAGTVRKEGGGTVRYTGSTSNSFAGSVVENNGILQMDGSFTGGAFAVNGGVLEGSGVVNAVSMTGGTLKPGDSPGILKVQGNLTMTNGAVFQVELNGTIAGSGYSQLQVNGSVNLNGATLQLQSGFTASPGASFIILLNNGTNPITGAFAGLPQGATIAAGAQLFQISYNGGDGNDVVLTQVLATLTATAMTGGIVLKNPDLASYLYNSTVTLSAIPIVGYAFAGWSGDASGTQNPLTIIMNASKVVTATFVSTVPDLIVDNTNATFTGSWTTDAGTVGTGFYGQDFRYAITASSNSAIATFRPSLPVSGNYDVYVWYPNISPHNKRCIDTRYTVSSPASTNTVSVDENSGFSNWMLIASGRKFSQGTNGFVQLSNQSDDTGTDAAADAVRWAYSTNQPIQPYITGINRNGTNVTLTWLSTSNYLYRLQYKTNLSDSTWQDISGDVPADSNTASKTDSSAGSAATRFYRVVLFP